ncbi:MAG: hypothetical protein WDW38_005199 [Sanguina aurantia]
MTEDGEKRGPDDLSFEGRAFESLERDFQEVLQELVGDKSLERFRIEYEKLHRALGKSHESGKRLIKKCRELNTEIVANAAKVQTALRLNEEDQSTITALKKEIEKAWKMVDASHEKEAKAKETIQQLKIEIANLTRLVEQGSGLALGEESTLNDLIRQKEELVRERDLQVDQIMAMRAELMDTQERLRLAESDKACLEGDIAALRESVAERRAEAEREMRKKERMEKEMKEMRVGLEARQGEIKQKQLQVASTEESVQRLEQMLRDSKFSTEKVQKEFNQLNEKVQKLHHDLEEQIHTNTQLLGDNSQKQVELKVKEDEISGIRAEAVRVAKLRDQTAKKIRDMASLERELEAKGREVEYEKKKLEELLRERDVLTKLRTLAGTGTGEEAEGMRLCLEEVWSRVVGLGAGGLGWSKAIFGEAAAGGDVGGMCSAKLHADPFVRFGDGEGDGPDPGHLDMRALEEVKLREMSIIDLQKRINEGEGKLKQQQNLYEAVRADRNLYSKNLIEAQDEIQEMKRKFKIMQHQIEQLKEEISAKDLALVKEHFDHMKVEKEKEALRMELNKAKQQIKGDIQPPARKAEIEKQNKHHQRGYQEAHPPTKTLLRNDELALLYEKIKIQQSTLSKGQIQYRDRLNEIRVLKIKLNDLKRELHILKSSVANIDVLKREVHQLGRELLQERTKVKALSEELENPLNVHRWRKLEGSDPSTYEMIQKIQTLQKRLITKTEEVVEKDLMIQEKEKLYMELKNILARQPGPEVSEQLSIYQANLREKTKQMKAMASELNMYQAQVNEYKYEIERLVREMTDLKRKYFDTRRREQMDKEKTSKIVMPGPAGVPRFTGGGFSLSQ